MREGTRTVLAMQNDYQGLRGAVAPPRGAYDQLGRGEVLARERSRPAVADDVDGAPRALSDLHSVISHVAA